MTKPAAKPVPAPMPGVTLTVATPTKAAAVKAQPPKARPEKQAVTKAPPAAAALELPREAVPGDTPRDTTVSSPRVQVADQSPSPVSARRSPQPDRLQRASAAPGAQRVAPSMLADPANMAQRVNFLLSQIASLPTLSPIATRVLSLSSADDPDFDAIIRLIEADPSLTTRVLALCRRASVSLSQPVTTVRRAAVLLGLEAIQSAVLSVQIYELMGKASNSDEARDEAGPSATRAPRFDRVGFWTHALAVATCAEALASSQRSLGVRPDEAFTGGLVHDLGKLALDWILPKTYSRAVELAELRQTDLADVERELIGLDHHLAGKRLAEHWALPHVLQDAMWLHGTPPGAMPEVPHRPLLAVVWAADNLCRRLHLGWSGSASAPLAMEDLARQSGVELAVLDTAAARLHAALALRCEELGLEGQSSPELVLQSVAAANSRLDRLNQTLRNRSLAARQQAAVLAATAEFSRRTRGNPTPIDTLRLAATGLVELRTALGAKTGGSTSGSTAGGNGLFLAGLFQSRPGEAWQFAAFGVPGPFGPSSDPVPPRLVPPPVDAAGQTIDLSALSAAAGSTAGGASLQGAVGLVTWLAEQLASHPHCPDLRDLSTVPIGGPIGPAALLLHNIPPAEGAVADAWMATLQEVWASALLSASQHHGAKRLAEDLAEANRQLSLTQHKLAEAQSLSRLGELSAGAAHEMNNPLTVISGRSQILSARLERERDRADLNEITSAARRLSDLIARLHTLSVPPPLKRASVNLTDLLTRAARDARAQATLAPTTEPEGAAKKNAKKPASIAATPANIRTIFPEIGVFPLLEVDGELLCRSITELLKNALEAGAREVTVRVQADKLPDTPLEIAVYDDGPGLSEHALRHAFDPFFSEKAAGRQPGLGLPIARRMVLLHGGELSIENMPNGGARASIRLPTWRRAVSRAA